MAYPGYTINCHYSPWLLTLYDSMVNITGKPWLWILHGTCYVLFSGKLINFLEFSLFPVPGGNNRWKSTELFPVTDAKTLVESQKESACFFSCSICVLYYNYMPLGYYFCSLLPPKILLLYSTCILPRNPAYEVYYCVLPSNPAYAVYSCILPPNASYEAQIKESHIKCPRIFLLVLPPPHISYSSLSK